MAGKLKRKLPLGLVTCLKLEAARGKGVEQLDRDKAAVGFAVLIRVIAHEPDIIKVRVLEFVARRDLGRVGRSDVRRTAQTLCNGGIGIDKRTSHLDLPRIELFQLLHVLGAVVDILAKVRIGRRSGKIDAAGRCADLPRFADGAGSRREIGRQDTGVDLKLLKRIIGNFCKLHL